MLRSRNETVAFFESVMVSNHYVWGPRPNMRLKLAGLPLLMESEWLCPDGHRTSSVARCAAGLAARSLSAIR